MVSKLEKELLQCNLSKCADFSDALLEYENGLYQGGIAGWKVYQSVPALTSWKETKCGYEFPRIHQAHRRVVDTVISLGVKKVCDAGAGAGVVSKYVYATQNDIELTCLEGSDAHIAQMIENFSESSDVIKPRINVPAKIVKGTLQKTGLETGAFDLVFTCTVMMHIPFLLVPKAVLELSRITNRYVLHVENPNDVINAVCPGNNRSDLNKLCIDYPRMYGTLGFKTVIHEKFRDPSGECDFICYLGEKAEAQR